MMNARDSPATLAPISRGMCVRVWASLPSTVGVCAWAKGIATPGQEIYRPRFPGSSTQGKDTAGGLSRPGCAAMYPNVPPSSSTQHTLRNALSPLISMCARLSGHKAVDRLSKSSLPSSIYVLFSRRLFDSLSNFPVLTSPDLAHRPCCVLPWTARPAPSKSSLRIAPHRTASYCVASHRAVTTRVDNLACVTPHAQPVYDAHVPVMVTRFPDA